MAGYLHLYYAHYKGISDTALIQEIKEKILQKARAVGAQYGSQNQSDLKNFESLFNTADIYQMSNFIGAEIASLQEDKLIGDDIESLLSALNNLINAGYNNLSTVAQQRDNIIDRLQKIIDTGAHLGVLTLSARSELQRVQQAFAEIHLEYANEADFKKNFNGEVIKSLTQLLEGELNNINGYVLELAGVIGLLKAHKVGIEQVIAIGGTKSLSASTAQIIEDPKLQLTLDEINNGIENLGGKQPKADILIRITDEKAEVGYSYAGIQAKNYSDPSKIHVSTYTLGNIGHFNESILKFTTHEEGLVNLAGALAVDTPMSYLLNNTDILAFSPLALSSGGFHVWGHNQEAQLGKSWSEIKNSTKMLAAFDAIVGKLNSQVTDKVIYYLVSSGGRTRLISAFNFVDKLIDRLNNSGKSGPGDSGGLGFAFYGVANANNRKDYVSLNAGSFSKDKSSIERSNIAYDAVLNAILKTKVDINLNFSSYFK